MGAGRKGLWPYLRPSTVFGVWSHNSDLLWGHTRRSVIIVEPWTLCSFRPGGVKDEVVGEKGQEDDPNRSLSKRHWARKSQPALPVLPVQLQWDSRILGEIACDSLQLLQDSETNIWPFWWLPEQVGNHTGTCPVLIAAALSSSASTKRFHLIPFPNVLFPSRYFP